jgi:hypothetical protein
LIGLRFQDFPEHIGIVLEHSSKAKVSVHEQLAVGDE